MLQSKQPEHAVGLKAWTAGRGRDLKDGVDVVVRLGGSTITEAKKWSGCNAVAKLTSESTAVCETF